MRLIRMSAIFFSEKFIFSAENKTRTDVPQFVKMAREHNWISQESEYINMTAGRLEIWK